MLEWFKNEWDIVIPYIHDIYHNGERIHPRSMIDKMMCTHILMFFASFYTIYINDHYVDSFIGTFYILTNIISFTYHHSRECKYGYLDLFMASSLTIMLIIWHIQHGIYSLLKAFILFIPACICYKLSHISKQMYERFHWLFHIFSASSVIYINYLNKNKIN